MEASTSIALLYKRLVDEGYHVTVSLPRKAQYISEARIKSDWVDSKALAELLRLNSLPESHIYPPHIANLREKVRRRAFLVRQRTKLNVKIKGVKLPKEHSLYTRKRREWLEGLGLESVACYIRVMETLREEIRRLSLELRHIFAGDEDLRLLVTVPNVGYYIALLVNAPRGHANPLAVVVRAIEGVWRRSHFTPCGGRIGACYIPRGGQPRRRREELKKSFT